ncbi:MAG TPA: hypothetical protein VLB44_22455 [Kofleriaceae bacterium]|nr:hypothetical protein [Kofleriaceae bacterium]
MSLRLQIVCLLALAGCRDRHAAERARRSPLETAIARELTARFSTPVTASCAVSAGTITRCEAALADGTKVPIEVGTDHTDWTWRVAGIVVEQKPITDYVTDELADLHVAQKVDCSPAVHVVQPGDRIACTLSGGGLAFVSVAADGTASLELELAPQAAAARGEIVTPQRDGELVKISRGLEGLEGESDGEEEAVPDGGLPTDLQGDGGVAKP